MAPCTHPGMKRLFGLRAKNGLITGREVHEARLPGTCGRPCAFEVKKTKKNTKSHQTLKKHTTKYIHRSPATATTSRRRAVKHVPLASPYSHSSSIDPGFVEIGLACIHTYVFMYILALPLLLRRMCKFWCSILVIGGNEARPQYLQ